MLKTTDYLKARSLLKLGVEHLKKNILLTLLILITIIIVGCTGAGENRPAKIGTLILNQGTIKTIEVAQEGTGLPNITISNSNKIYTLLNKVKEIPVKRLSKQDDSNFITKRLKYVPFLTVMFYSDNTSKKLEGQFYIWPDGYIYIVEVNSMAGNQRTISYLSELKYTEIYKWITDSASASMPTQIDVAEQFVKSQGYQIILNSSANFDFQLPSSFVEIQNGVHIGDLLKKRNELSKQNGFDFSSYLGKKATIITYAVETKKNTAENFDLIMDENKVVGFWVDSHGEPPDFNVIVNAY